MNIYPHWDKLLFLFIPYFSFNLPVLDELMHIWLEFQYHSFSFVPLSFASFSCNNTLLGFSPSCALNTVNRKSFYISCQIKYLLATWCVRWHTLQLKLQRLWQNSTFQLPWEMHFGFPEMKVVYNNTSSITKRIPFQH